MTQKEVKGPSLGALGALTTLAVALWMEIDLATALFRSVLVYLGLSMLIMAYRVILSRFVASAQQKAEQELLEKIEREAEEEQRKLEEERAKQAEERAKGTNGARPQQKKSQAGAPSGVKTEDKDMKPEEKETEDAPA